jgi:hypothetical protein
MSDKPPPSDPWPGPGQWPTPHPSRGWSEPGWTSPEQAESSSDPPPAASGGDWVGGGGPVSAGPAGGSGAADPGAVDGREPPEAGTDSPLDPSVAAGPPWPRLVVVAGEYTPPRLIRWPIAVGIVLFVGSILLRVVVSPGSSSTTVASSGSPYMLVANDAAFSATFPAKPQRSQQSLGTAPNQLTYISYDAPVADEDVGVASFSLPESTPFELDGAITGQATSISGKVTSRSRLIYHGQPAEDGVITTSGGVERTRVVRFGSSVYILIGVNGSSVSPGPGYQTLLRTFSHS